MLNQNTIRHIGLSALMLGTLVTSSPAIGADASFARDASATVPRPTVTLERVKQAFDRQNNLNLTTRIDDDGDLEIILNSIIPVWVREVVDSEQFVMFTLIQVAEAASEREVQDFIDRSNRAFSDAFFVLTEHGAILAFTPVHGSSFETDRAILGVYRQFLGGLAQLATLDTDNVIH